MKLDTLREQAAHYCALMASSNARADGPFLFNPRSPMPPGSDAPVSYMPDATGDNDSAAACLARAAYWSKSAGRESGRESWAEAEALLRCGWSP